MKKFLSVALALVMVFTLSLSAFASDYEFSEAMPELDFESYPYVYMIKYLDFGIERGYLFATPWPLEFVSDDTGGYSLVATGEGTYRYYNYNMPPNYGGWSYDFYEGYDGKMLLGKVNGFKNNTHIEVANYNLNLDGAPFLDGDENFGVTPLTEVVQEVVNQAMALEMAKMEKTMGLLTVCGIGCLALLIGLVLFGKRSLLSLR